VRRAARYDGLFPIGLGSPDDLRAMLAVVAAHRPDDAVDARFDVAVQGRVGTDPRPWIEAGATWWLVLFDPFTVTAAEVRDAIGRRPAQ
jgi:hypothetical protein